MVEAVTRGDVSIPTGRSAAFRSKPHSGRLVEQERPLSPFLKRPSFIRIQGETSKSPPRSVAAQKLTIFGRCVDKPAPTTKLWKAVTAPPAYLPPVAALIQVRDDARILARKSAEAYLAHAGLYPVHDLLAGPAPQYAVDGEAIAGRGGQHGGVKSQIAELQARDRPVLQERSAGQ
jgi:hypothetical protein